MDQNSFQDIIPPKKTIRDIPLPEERKSKLPPTLHFQNQPSAPVFADIKIKKTNQGKGLGVWMMWLVGIITVVVLAFVGLSIFSSVKVRVALNNENVNLDIHATSTKDGASSTLPYSIATFQKSDSVVLNATGTPKEVKTKASGTIIIYNSGTAQQLVVNTRFETTDGLIYRIDKAVLVPGQTTVSGKTLPGTVEAVVYADEVGDKYNKGKSDFTIPGFKGTTKFQTIYAKSKTEITGGFSGTTQEVSPEVLKQAEESLSEKIKKQITDDAKVQVGDSAVFFYQGLVVNNKWSVVVSNNQTVLYGTSTAIAPVFSKQSVLELIQKQTGQNFKSINGFDKVDVVIDNKDALTSTSFPSLVLNIKGAISSVQNVTIDELQKRLAGKPKGSLQDILIDYPAISRIDAVFMPPWQTKFPKNVNKINIVLQNAN